MKKLIISKKNSGITLIALVITIIVLLILAGVSILTLIGPNGLLTKGNEAVVKHNHSQVKEALILESAENVTENKGYGKNTGIVEFLQEKEIIGKEAQVEGKYIIDVEKLLGRKLNLGNGNYTDGIFKDVYVLEEYAENKYKVMYYEKEGIDPVEILDLGNAKNKIEQDEPVVPPPSGQNSKKLTIEMRDDQENTLSNVEFSIYTDENCNTLYDNKSNVKTGSDGTYQMDIPPVGKYYIKLIKSPNSCYNCILTEIDITSTEEDKTQNIELKNQLPGGPVQIDVTKIGSLMLLNVNEELAQKIKGQVNYKLYKMADYQLESDNSINVCYNGAVKFENSSSYTIISDDEAKLKSQEKTVESSLENCTFSNLEPGIYMIYGEAENAKMHTFVAIPWFDDLEADISPIYDISYSISEWNIN